MSEDDSSTHSAQHETPEKRRSWLERISSALSGGPTTRKDLVELLRDAQADGLIAADTLRMMEGAIAVSDLTVGDVMIPRTQMVALPAEAKLLDLMKKRVKGVRVKGVRFIYRPPPRHHDAAQRHCPSPRMQVNSTAPGWMSVSLTYRRLAP